MARSLRGERHRLNKRAMRDGFHTPRQLRLLKWRAQQCLHPQHGRMMLSGYVGCAYCGARVGPGNPSTPTSDA